MRKNNTSSNFIKLLEKKKWFLMKVYASLVFQILITFAIMYYFRYNLKISKMSLMTLISLIIASILLTFTIIFFKNVMPVWLTYILISLLSMTFGALLHYSSRNISIDVINQIALSVLLIFVGFTIMAFILANLGIDLSWMGIYLLYALIGLICISLVLFIIRVTDNANKQPNNNNIRRVYLTGGIILFCIIILYDTNIMLQKDYQEDYILASIELYLDIINIFSKMIGLENIED